MAWLSDQTRILGTVLLPGGRLEPAIVHVEAGRISGLEKGPPPETVRAAHRDRAGVLALRDDEVLAPAFIDVHCHGAGGGDVMGGDEAIWRMAATLLRHGTTAVVAAIATAPIPQLMEAARAVGVDGRAQGDMGAGGEGQAAQTAPDGQDAPIERPPRATVFGLHLEGPALCPSRSAGHDPTAFAQPADLTRSLRDDSTAWRSVRMVTLAPELPGALDLVAQLSAAGIVVSVGHTDASMEVATAAYAAGARSTTHLFNGMPPLRAREPGPVGAALASAPFVELITDGVHVAAAILPSIAQAIGDERLVLVSDALPLAGSRLRSVRTPGSTARLVDGRAVHPDGTLAGSRLLLDGMVASATGAGIALPVALRAATENPARLLGLADRGHLVPGAVADLVVVSRAGRLRRVVSGGSIAARLGRVSRSDTLLRAVPARVIGPTR